MAPSSKLTPLHASLFPYRVFRSRMSFSRRLKMAEKPNLHNKTSQYYYHKASPFCLEPKNVINFFKKCSKFWNRWFNDENFSKRKNSSSKVVFSSKIRFMKKKTTFEEKRIFWKIFIIKSTNSKFWAFVEKFHKIFWFQT